MGGRRAQAEPLELPDGLVLPGELEEQLGALEGSVRGPARQRLVAEDVERLELEDRLVDRPDPPLAENLAEASPAEAPCRSSSLVVATAIAWARAAVDEPLDAHLRVRPQQGVADEDADPLVDPGAEGFVEGPAQRLFDLARLALQPDHRLLPRLERGEDVEVGAARAVDGDEVLGREDRSDHPPQGPGGVLQEAVEDFPAVGLLDVAVLLDVDVEDAHVAVVEEPVAQRVDDDRAPWAAR